MVEAVLSDEVRVLVYESSTVQRRILEAMLKLAGYDILSVYTAEDALREARSGAFGIFISNIEHSDMSGLELFWHLKADENALGIYCIAVTAGEKIKTVAEALDSGADDFIRKPYEEVELNARVRAASRTVQLQRKLIRLALTDAMTGVANRRAFMERLESEVSRARRHGNTLSVIMTDIDHFKRVNDTYGHAAGDIVICDTVTRMGARIRQSDLLGRLGGEEFAVLLPETDEQAAMALAEHLRKTVDAQPFQIAQDCAVPVSVSLGVARWTGDDKSAEDLLSRADHALYLSKEAGRNRVSCAETARVLVAEHAS